MRSDIPDDAESGMVNSFTGVSAEARIQHAVENRPDQQRGQGLRRAHTGHQQNTKPTDAERRAASSAAAGTVPSCPHPQRFHGRERLRRRKCRRSTAAVSTCDSVRQGAHVTGSDGPNNHHHRNSEGRRDVRRSAVVADEQRRARDQAFHPLSGAFFQTVKLTQTATHRRRGRPGTPASARLSRARPRQIAPPARSWRQPTRTDESRRSAAGPVEVRATSLARGISLRGTPSQNIADAKCSAVWTAPFDAQNLLRPRNLVGIKKTIAMVRESRAKFRARRRRHPHAARAAVKIQHQIGARHASRGSRRRPDCLRKSRQIAARRSRETSRSGRYCLSSASAGVVSTQSPRDRRRITAIREPDGSRSSRFATLILRCGLRRPA